MGNVARLFTLCARFCVCALPFFRNVKKRVRRVSDRSFLFHVRTNFFTKHEKISGAIRFFCMADWQNVRKKPFKLFKIRKNEKNVKNLQKGYLQNAFFMVNYEE